MVSKLADDQRVGELKEQDGVSVDVIDYYVWRSDFTDTSPETFFAEQVSWSAFKESVITKAESGSVAVSVDYENMFCVSVEPNYVLLLPDNLALLHSRGLHVFGAE